MTSTSKASVGPRCPICKSTSVADYKPFCSKRCADIDLGKWFSNAYAIAGAPADDEADAPREKPADDAD